VKSEYRQKSHETQKIKLRNIETLPACVQLRRGLGLHGLTGSVAGVRLAGYLALLFQIWKHLGPVQIRNGSNINNPG
jgi:hypothetical protein